MLLLKKIFLASVPLSLGLNGLGQVNLVPNPSFEDTVSCPFGAGDLDMSTGWVGCGSADFFNECNQFDWGSPNNVFGFQQPAGGKAYSGFISFSSDLPNTREFVSCFLPTPLNIGTEYFVSFKISLGLDPSGFQSNSASDKIGAMFTTYTYDCDTLLSTPFLTNNPHLYEDSIIVDSAIWTRITGSFIADSAYTYLRIGNFFDDSNTDTIRFISGFTDYAYYYVDDICVSTDSSFAYNYDYTVGLNNDLSTSFSFYPNPASEFLKIDNELAMSFDVELCDALGQQLFYEKGISSKEFQLNLNQYGKGVYIVKIISDNNQLIYKFLKQ